MFTKKVYSLKDMVKWTFRDTLLFLIVVLIPIIIYEIFGQKWLQIPWTPIALIGTAVAFVIGFQNNAAYDRIWEARKIWGGIVNTSRSFGIMISDTITNEYAKNPASKEELQKFKTTIIYRHIAWLTALRHAMRQGRSWEVFMEHKSNNKWAELNPAPEYRSTLEDDLTPLLSKDDKDIVLSKTNKNTALLTLQSKQLRNLKEQGIIWEFSFLELEGLLVELFNLQGKSERIKNFPYPRQYATLNHYFVWIFICFLPLAIIPEFDKIGENLIENFPTIGRYFVWLAIPFTVVVSWVFHTMERIGRSGENPFEGTANDVPISTIARGIEIDLREMLDEDKANIPKQFPEIYNVQM